MVFSGYGHGGDVYRNKVKYDFSANVNFLGTPKEVIQAIQQGAEEICKYPNPYCDTLREKLGEKYGLDKDDFICANGAAELIFNFVQAVMPQNALVIAPSFSEYTSALNTVKCNINYHILKQERGFEIDESFVDKIGDNTDIVFICNPNNPTGIITKKDMLNKILQKCRQTDSWLFVDECFLDMTENLKEDTIIPLLKENDKVFVLKAFTKMYGMAGVRLGYAVCFNKKIMEDISFLQQPWNVSSLAQCAGIAALDCECFAQKTRELVKAEKLYLKKELDKLGISYTDGKANYLLIKSVKDLSDKLIEKGILIRSCKNYVGLDDTYFRIAVRSHIENEILINALKEIF